MRPLPVLVTHGSADKLLLVTMAKHTAAVSQKNVSVLFYLSHPFVNCDSTEARFDP
jgi:hypothetical protein